MGVGERKLRRVCLGGLAAAAACAAISASAAADSTVSWMNGAHPQGTPANLDRVGVIKVGPRSAPNVLVFVPGSGGGAGKQVPLAQAIVKKLPGWQVWAVERRENLLEDQSVLNRAKRGRATPRKLFNYYLRWTTDPSISNHVQPVPDSRVGFARDWGMKVEVNDLHHVVRAAAGNDRTVVLGGVSLGGVITTAYATWDFGGKAGVDDLSGLVYSDGSSALRPITAKRARLMLRNLQNSSPWSAEGGIPAPFGALLSDVGAALTKMDPNGRSLLQDWSGLPPEVVPPMPVTNEALFGYSLDTETSPSSLVTLQIHAGHLAASGDPRPWVRDGELTPIQRYARAVAGWGLQGTDGPAWYHPMRLTIDQYAVANGNANPAQQVLDLKATHGNDIDVPIYAFAASFGDGGVLEATRSLAQQSHLPKRELTLVDRSQTYAHNDATAAFPHNAFVNHLVPFLKGIGKG